MAQMAGGLGHNRQSHQGMVSHKSLWMCNRFSKQPGPVDPCKLVPASTDPPPAVGLDPCPPEQGVATQGPLLIGQHVGQLGRG